MKEVVEMANPIHLIRLKTPDFVWEWYEDKFRAAVQEETGGVNNTYKTWSTTFYAYRDGRRGKSSVFRINIKLRKVIEKVLPILHPGRLFELTEEEMRTEALETANRMIAAYNEEYKSQLREANVEA